MSHQENIISAQIDGGLYEKQALLDDFAKAAMQGVITYHGHNAGTYDYLAKISYDIASAMMQERERRMKG